MIGAFCMGLVCGAAAVILILELIVRPTQQQVYTILESERDAAKHEAKVYRNLLFPVLARVENPAEVTPVTNVTQVTSKGSPPKPSNPFFDRRTPFRLRFKMAGKALNSKQQRTNALASALEKQKPSGEKSNA